MNSLPERILALEQISPATGFEAGSSLPREIVIEALAILRDQNFRRLPLDRQCSFLDFVQAAYISTYDPSAPDMAEAIETVFQGHLQDRKASLSRLFKTYDLLYFLRWCNSTSIEQQRGFATQVALPFSRYLKPRKLAVMDNRLEEDQPIRLAYLAQFAHDTGGNALGLVLESLLSSLQEHFYGEYELFLYSWMYKDLAFLERISALGVRVRRFDLGEYKEMELVALRQAFFDDRIAVALTDMNSAVPHYLFERRVAPVQIFYQLGLPFWPLENLDAVFQGWEIDPERLGLEAGRCHAVPAPKTARHISTPVDMERVRVERQRFPESAHVIGFYGRLVKITPTQCEIIRRILLLHSDAIAVIGGTGNAAPILRFVEDNQLAGRVFVVNEFVDGAVWGHILDVFLDTFPLTGGYSCREVLAKGKPIVHMRSEDMPNLNTFLDSDLAADSVETYVACVSQLLSDTAFYRRFSERALDISREQADLKPFATTFNSAVRRAIDRTRSRSAKIDDNSMTEKEGVANILA